jgi:hypothetical protein
VPRAPVGAGGLPRRAHPARVAPWGGHLDLEDPTARAGPGARWGTCRVQAGCFVPPARLGPLGLRADRVGQRLPHRVAGAAGDRAPGSVGCAPRHPRGRGQGTVTAQEAPGGGPRVPQPLAPTLAPRQPVGTAAALGLEARGAQTPREACLQGEGPATIAPIIAIGAALGLGTRRAVLGGIGRQHADRGGTGGGRHPWSHHHQSQALHRGA